jgi:hypothetical protein
MFIAPVNVARSRAPHRAVQCVVAVLALLFAIQPGLTHAAQPQSGPQAVYFSQTGHGLDNRYGFLDYWCANGQINRFGAPITEALEEDGRPVQYFERARFEYHLEAQGTPFEVQLGLLGREAAAGQQFPVGTQMAGRTFPETGYTVFGKFLDYWNNWGSMAAFGYPISESFVTTLPDGSNVAVQYFERVRLEYHPENVPEFYRERRQANNTRNLMLNEITIGKLGSEMAQQHGYDTAPVARQAGVPEWSPALWPQRIDVNLTTQQLVAYEGNLPVLHAPVSTGRDGFETAQGSFHVYAKLLYDDMTGTLQGEEYDVRKVPYVMYFHEGYALHGTYWHDLFGTGVRASHGCVNLPMDKAQWLWEWEQPAWSQAKASRISPSLKPKNDAEAALQPLEGLATFQQGATVVVHE